MQWESAFSNMGIAMRSSQMTLGGLVVVVVDNFRQQQGSLNEVQEVQRLIIPHC